MIWNLYAIRFERFKQRIISRRVQFNLTVCKTDRGRHVSLSRMRHYVVGELNTLLMLVENDGIWEGVANFLLPGPHELTAAADDDRIRRIDFVHQRAQIGTSGCEI
ncbi:hypothetical protein PBS_49760 [Paraburkholderia sp. 2C]